MQEALTVIYTNDVFDDTDFLLLYEASNNKIQRCLTGKTIVST